MEEEKVKAIKEWKTPTNVKDVKSFLGFANFYQQFIKDFSHITIPLNQLKGKGEWKWEEKEQNAFEKLKQKIMIQPVLALPRKEEKFRVEVDASGHAIGGVLSQEQEGKWKPVTFLLRTMSPTERNYEMYNKELLAIVEALYKWQQYLLDAIEKFEVWTDHENLKYFKEPHKLNGQQARWYLKLQDYDFTLWHIPEKTNTKADILSRKEKVDTKEDNQDIQMLKEELWIWQTTIQDGIPIVLLRQEYLQIREEGIEEWIRKIQTREQEVTKQLEKKNGQLWEENGIIYIDGKIYVPRNRQLRDEILNDNHNLPDIRHLGQHRMMELIKRNYWWPEIHNDVWKYVRGCQECQQNKVQHMKKVAPLYPLPTPKTPWEEISIDVIGPLPRSEDKDTILVVVN